MKEIKKALESLKGTLIEEDLLSISAFYDALDKDLEHFKEKAGFSCPSGCGKCCSIFIPDITRLESICIAAFIAFSENKAELIQMLENAKGRKTETCPLYRDSNPFHCSAYSARPLICRLFASSCFFNKNGEKKFSPCHLNNSFVPAKRIDEESPAMSYYGENLLSLSSNNGETEFLADRVLKDLDLINFYLSLRKAE